MGKKANLSKKIAFMLSDRGFRYNKVALKAKILCVALFCWYGIYAGVVELGKGVKPRCVHVMYQLLPDEIRFSIIPKVCVGIVCISCIILTILIFSLINKKKKNSIFNTLLITQFITLSIYITLNITVTTTKCACYDKCNQISNFESYKEVKGIG